MAVRGSRGAWRLRISIRVANTVKWKLGRKVPAVTRHNPIGDELAALKIGAPPGSPFCESNPLKQESTTCPKHL